MQPRLATLREGQVIEGEIAGLHLLHGCMVDIGNEWHGMAFFTEDEWRELRDDLTLFAKVTVRVHKVRGRSGWLACLRSQAPSVCQHPM